MRVIGVDPGSRVTGWAVVDRERGRYRLVAAGAIKPPTGAEIPDRLCAIHAGLVAAITTWAPETSAIEAIFSHRSATSALVLGQARGVALLALAQAGLEIHAYNASTVKLSVTGSGSADKGQIGRMVAALLGEAVAGPADASDAAAVAITHHAHAGRPRLPTRGGAP